MKPAPDLQAALQVLAVRRARDVRWAERMIKRNRLKALLCRACNAAVSALRRIDAL